LVRLIFYGGAGEIGGNKIMVEDHGSKVLLDFGMSLTDRGRFFSEPFLSPRDEQGLIQLGITPGLNGLYKGDAERAASAVVLSHSHIDHSMCVSLLNRDIPVYCGETTRLILEATSGMRQSGFENNLSGIQFRTFRTGDKIDLGSIQIEPVHVDHSVPGSYGFLVHTSEGTIAYSGDFRAHGPRSDMTFDFAEKAHSSQPKLFLCEGTNLVRGDLRTESEVSEKAERIVENTKGLVLANFSTADTDRLKTFHETAKKTDRVLAVSLKQAHLLSSLLKDDKLGTPDPIHDPDIVVYQKTKKTYFHWEQEIIQKANVKTSKDVRASQGSVILAATSYDMNELLDIRPGPAGAFINSSSEPFNEEMEIDHERFVNWLNYFGLPMYQIHSSGHMMPTELRQVVARIAPSRLVPIHTEQPRLFELFMKDLAPVDQVQKESELTL
jgi:ribonuclease J